MEKTSQDKKQEKYCDKTIRLVGVLNLNIHHFTVKKNECGHEMTDIMERLYHVWRELEKEEKKEQCIRLLKLINKIKIEKYANIHKMDEFIEQLRLTMDELKQMNKQKLKDFTKEKTEEFYEKTDKMIDRFQKLFDDVEIEKNANKVKMNKFKKRINKIKDNQTRRIMIDYLEGIINRVKCLNDFSAGEMDVLKNKINLTIDELKKTRRFMVKIFFLN